MLTLAVASSLLAQAPLSAGPAPVPLDPVSRQILDAHNRERSLMGSPPLVWDPALARAAASYGPALAALGRLQHSPRETRPGQRENLWRGSARGYLPAQMVGMWIDEKRHFRPGIFPAVSATGQWGDVGHYTQLIWPTTTRVGCAVHRTPTWDFLICRYSPPGNVDGKPIGNTIGERG